MAVGVVAILVGSALSTPSLPQTDAADPAIAQFGFGTREAGTTSEQYIVRFRSADALQATLAGFEQRGSVPLDAFEHGIPAIALAADDPELARLTRSPDVIGVEASQTFTVAADPPWGLDRIDQRALPLDRRFMAGSTGIGVTVYVVDGGLRLTHTEFTGRILRAAFPAGDPNGANDCSGHGTHVTGTLGGASFGVAPGVGIIPVKVFDCFGNATEATLLAGIDWIVQDHQPGTPAVVNMSLSGGGSPTVDAAVDALVADGITVVVAAGNQNADACQRSPAEAPAAITVAASDINDVRASFSNWGGCVDLFAPGVAIQSAYATSDTATATLDGTSMAAPHVTGAAALYLAAHPAATPAQVAAAIDASATTALPTGLAAGDPAKLLYLDSVQLTAATAGTGSGTVSSPSGLSCTTSCSLRLVRGAPATLTATASFGSTFTGWSGGGCAGTGSCTLAVGADTTVTGTFTLNSYPITVAKAGSGTGIVQSMSGVTCGTTCEQSLLHGSEVSFIASPGAGSVFTGWSGGGCSGTGLCTVRVTGATTVTATFTLQLFSAFPQPVRLFDTRPGQRGVLEQTVDEVARFGAGEVRRYTPGPFVEVANGAVLAVNVVAVVPDANGYLQVFPCASPTSPPPDASFLNYTAGVTIANNGTVAVDSEGGFCVLSSRGAHVIVDTTGTLPTGSFTPLPQRLLDSRPGRLGALEQPGGLIGTDVATPLAAGVPQWFAITGSNGIVGQVAALALNIAVVNSTGNGYVSAYPCPSLSSLPPSSSTVNYRAGGAVANGAVVAPNSAGAICVVSSRQADVIIDITGFFPTGHLTPLAAPVRLVDSRPGQLGTLEQSDGSIGTDLTVPLVPFMPRRLVVTGANGIPGTIGGLAVNVVAVGPQGGGFLTLYPCDDPATPPPASSTINFAAGATLANGALVRPTAAGGLCVYSSQPTNFLIDATGYVPA